MLDPIVGDEFIMNLHLNFDIETIGKIVKIENRTCGKIFTVKIKNLKELLGTENIKKKEIECTMEELLKFGYERRKIK